MRAGNLPAPARETKGKLGALRSFVVRLLRMQVSTAESGTVYCQNLQSSWIQLAPGLTGPGSATSSSKASVGCSETPVTPVLWMGSDEEILCGNRIMLCRNYLRAAMKVPRVILADDHTILLEAFRKLLEPRCEVVATVSDGRALLQVAPSLNPDVIVVDVSMPLLNGLEAARQLRDRLPSAKLIFLTMNEDPDLAAEVMRFGASGYLLKSSAAEELFRAIQEALKGRTYLTPKIAKGVQDVFVRDPAGEKRGKTLTPRQREVVQLLAEGKSMKEAADILNVTPRTVAFHKYQAMEALRLKTTAELIQFAIKSRIVIA